MREDHALGLQPRSQPAELTRRHNFGNTQAVALGLICAHAFVLLLLLAVFGEHIKVADRAGWLDGQCL
ncbi:MAG: hypothetical protein M3069_33165 [Chloroflexota bacterium]|nr:hypothetical protein [Chloroflexota bacterium]